MLLARGDGAEEGIMGEQAWRVRGGRQGLMAFVLLLPIFSSGCGTFLFARGPAPVTSRVSMNGKELEKGYKVVRIDGQAPGAGDVWGQSPGPTGPQVRADKVHEVEFAAELDDADFAWGKGGKLAIEWRGTGTVDHSVSVPVVAMDVMFTAGIGVIVDAITGGFYYHPRDLVCAVSLSPAADADDRRRAYVERELATAATLEKDRDVVGAARLLELAAAACKKRGFADLEKRARDGLQKLGPSLTIVRQHQKKLAALLVDGTLALGLPEKEPGHFLEFQGGEPVVYYVSDFGDRYVKFTTVTGGVGANLDGGEVNFRAMFADKKLYIEQVVAGRLDPDTGAFTGRMRSRTVVESTGSVNDEEFELSGKVVQEKPRLRRRK